jgi:BirA family transcriptional regulator, biotin operon repressor / biotin---[acetyl-CoA-carboxylase] ligase
VLVTDAPAGVARRPLDAEALARVLPGWARPEVLDEVGSTNAVTAARARSGEGEGLVVVAEHQTSGQGRLGRVWESPRYAGLTFSVLLHPPVADRRWPWLPLLTGVAVVEGIAAVGGPACALKWPNDVQHDGLKLAGVLAERLETPRGPGAVVGVGLNVSQTASELPVPTATSLATVGFPVDRTVLLRSVLERLHARYQAWGAAGTDGGLRDRYLPLSDTVGREVRVELPGGVLEGEAVDVDHEGGLVVSVAGRRTSVTAGDVLHLRPR